MALIKCSVCGADISEKAPICPKCGKENQVLLAEKENASLKWRKRIKIMIIFAVALAAVVVVGRWLIRMVEDSHFDESETYVLERMRELKSIKGAYSINGNILYSANKNGDKFVIAEIMSSDGTEIVYFKNGKYIGTDTEYERIKNRDINDYYEGRVSKSEYSDILDRKVLFAEAEVVRASWNLVANAGEAGDENTHLVSCRKIGKKLGIKYYE